MFGARQGQAVQITTYLGDSVVSMHRLDGEACGRVRGSTRAMLGGAAALILGGLVAALLSSLGSGASLLLLGTALGVFAATRADRERRAPHFLVGEGRDAQLPLPSELLPARCYPLVLATPGGYHLVFGAGMEGLVEENGSQISLRQLVASGRAWPAAGLPACTVPLPLRGRAVVRIGESTVTVDAIEPSPSLRAPLLGGLDSSGLLSNAFSFSAHAVVLLLVFAIPPSGNVLSLDSFNIDSRTVRYQIRPQDMEHDKVPPWLGRNVNQDRPAGGPTTKGDPGKLGNPKARPLRGRLAVRGKSPDLRAAKEWARQAARDYGILGIMQRRRGGPFAHIFGSDTALGSDAMDAMGTLIAQRVGEDNGTGGLRYSGPGRMGGGDARDIIPGTGLRIVNGKGPGGWGPWAAPRENLRDHRTKMPPQRPVIQVKGALDKELIRREIKRHINEIRFCYSKELQGKPELQGRVVVNFTIAPSGRVVSSQINQTTLRDQDVESCITQAFFRWSFPKPPDQGMVIVSYPFIFHATEQ